MIILPLLYLRRSKAKWSNSSVTMMPITPQMDFVDVLTHIVASLGRNCHSIKGSIPETYLGDVSIVCLNNVHGNEHCRYQADDQT